MVKIERKTSYAKKEYINIQKECIVVGSTNKNWFRFFPPRTLWCSTILGDMKSTFPSVTRVYRLRPVIELLLLLVWDKRKAIEIE